MSTTADSRGQITAERLEGSLSTADLAELCDAADAAIAAGGGFGWLRPPERPIMERYWKGITLVRGRELFVARLDGVICGSAQLQMPPGNNDAQAHMVKITGQFVAPWARGRGAARALIALIEDRARGRGFKALRLDMRATQSAAIQLYEGLGYQRWGVNPYYALVDGQPVPGYYYIKKLEDFGP